MNTHESSVLTINHNDDGDAYLSYIVGCKVCNGLIVPHDNGEEVLDTIWNRLVSQNADLKRHLADNNGADTSLFGHHDD